MIDCDTLDMSKLFTSCDSSNENWKAKSFKMYLNIQKNKKGKNRVNIYIYF